MQERVKEKGDDIDLENLREDIRSHAVSLGVEKDIKYHIAFQSVFTLNILEEFPKFKTLFKQMIAEDGQDGVKALIMAMVHFFVVTNPELEIAIPSFLKFAYEADILEEDLLLKWEDKKFKTDKKSSLYSKKNEKKFKKAAAKFFEWLKEAESDEEEESEEEDELTEEQLKAKKMQELIEKDKATAQMKAEEAKKAKEQEEEEKVLESTQEGEKIDVLKVEVDDDDDVDIDDI